MVSHSGHVKQVCTVYLIEVPVELIKMYSALQILAHYEMNVHIMKHMLFEHMEQG